MPPPVSVYMSLIPTPIGGIEPCIASDCEDKVTWHALIKRDGYLVIPPRKLYWCQKHFEELSQYACYGSMPGLPPSYLLGN
jgi:hypothetical protein